MIDDTTDKDDGLIAAEYALGLLTPDEARAFEDLLAIDPAFRSDYAFWAEGLSSMAADAPEVTPPPDILSRLKAYVAADRAERAGRSATAPVSAGVPFWRRLRILPPLAGGLLAALVLLWGVDRFVSLGPVPPAAVAELVSEDESLQVTVSYTEDGRSLRVERLAGAAPPGRVLELWVIKDGQTISLGVLPDDRDATLQVAEALQPMLRGARCAISVELPGGSISGTPDQVLAVAPIVWS